MQKLQTESWKATMQKLQNETWVGDNAKIAK